MVPETILISIKLLFSSILNHVVVSVIPPKHYSNDFILKIKKALDAGGFMPQYRGMPGPGRGSGWFGVRGRSERIEDYQRGN